MMVVVEFKIEYLQYLDMDGMFVCDDLFVLLCDFKVLVLLFKQMLFVCMFDSKFIVLQCIGKFGIYVVCLGYEVVYVGIGVVMQKDDVFVFLYCEYGVMFMCGVCLYDVLMYWGGDECGNDYGGNVVKDFLFCVLIFIQCLYVVGVVLKFKFNKELQIVVVVCGDGGSFKIDFYVVLNLVGVYKFLLILCIVNNGWVILVLCLVQIGVEMLVQKGLVGGLYCLQVDGNDLIVVLVVMEQVCECVLVGDGGIVLELMIYCLFDYIIVDDVCCYCDDVEVKDVWQCELMLCLCKYLINVGVWSEQEEIVWVVECGVCVDEEVNLYFNILVQLVEVMFDFLYVDLLLDLLVQCVQVIVLEKCYG